MPTVGKTTFTWFTPNASQHDEHFGPDANGATATVQLAPGTLANRRQAVVDLLEYPVFLKDAKRRAISRHLPLAYPPPFTSVDPDDSNNPSGLYANRFVSGEGIGPIGNDGTAAALPVYKYYRYETEFTDRTYDILPDSAVLAPGPIGPPSLNSLVSGVGGSMAAGTYEYVVTATTSWGETTRSNELAVTVVDGATVTVSWTPVAGANGYRIYRGFNQPATAENYLIAAPTPGNRSSYVDNLVDGSGINTAPPAVNTTASPLWDPVNPFPDEGTALANGDGRTGGRYVTRTSRPGGRIVTIPKSVLYYTDTGLPLLESIGKVVPTVSLNYTWHLVPRPGVPIRAIINSIGTVNNAAFDGWPAGTLLFDSLDYKRYRSSILGRVADLQYVFSGLPNVDLNGVAQGHNAALEFTGGPHSAAAAAAKFNATVGVINAILLTVLTGGAAAVLLAAVIAKAATDAGATAEQAKAAHDAALTPVKVDYVRINSAPDGTGNAPYRTTDFSALFRPDQG